MFVLITYLLAFVVCLSVSILSTWYVRNFAQAHGWVEIPQLERHVHTIPVPRLGGVAIFLSFMLVMSTTLMAQGLLGLGFVLPIKTTLSLLGPALIVFLLGLYDDLHGIGPFGKFGVQAVAAALLYLGGFGIHRLDLVSTGHPLRSAVGLPLTILWVLLITNAFNLIDGLDGLAAGSALFSTIVVFIVSLIVPNPMVTFLTIVLAGAILGFLRFNFHPASIFLGDSGSLFIGFMLGALALAGSQKAPTMVAVALPVVSLGLPILDVGLAIVRRFLSRKPLFRGDSQHIHHKLLKRGLSQRDAVLILYAVTAGFGFLSLVLLQGRTTLALVLAVIGIGIFLGMQQLRYQEFAELLSVLQHVSRRRQVLANHVAIRNATESLSGCAEFRSICEVLQGTLQAVGFDGIRLQMLKPNGFSPSMLHPLRHGSDGNLFFSWSEGQMGEPPWELRLELLTSSQDKWGYLTLIRMSDGEALSLDVNILTGEFRSSLSKAVERACARLEASKQGEGDIQETRTHKLAAGSMAD
jgi:UDP-GlcNAc:undecaprenyl-phosphate/decaprenyl-phosphate GlcNAc-1-phosphate transferase